MPTYTVKDPKTGQTISLTGDSPPTEAELEEVFAKVASQRPEMTYAIVNGKRVPVGSDEADVNPRFSLPTVSRGDVTGGVRDALQSDPLFGENTRNAAVGFVKRAGETATTLGQLVHKIPGVTRAVDAVYDAAGLPGTSAGAFAEAHRDLQPTNTAQKVGGGIEQAAEFAAAGGPVSAATKGAPLIVRAAAEAGLGGGMAAFQGNSPTVGAVTGAAGPVVGDIGTAVAKWVESKAVPIVRAGLKTPLSILNKQSGVSVEGLNEEANDLAQFIVDKRITNRATAMKIVRDAESEIQRLMNSSAGSTLTDAPTRAMAYLKALKQSASKSLTPDAMDALEQLGLDTVAKTNLGQTITTTHVIPGTAIGGKPPLTITNSTRQLRPAIPAREALEMARETSKWEGLSKQYGELKAAPTEGIKQMVRGVKDAVKDAVGAIRTPLQQEGQALLAAKVMDRALVREGNRDTLALPTVIAATTSNVMAVAVQFLRNNQRRVGVWADVLGKAVQGNDVATVAAVLHRLGVGVTTQAVGGDTELPPGTR